MPSVDKVETKAIGLGIIADVRRWDESLVRRTTESGSDSFPGTQNAHRTFSSLLKSQVFRLEAIFLVDRLSPIFQFGEGWLTYWNFELGLNDGVDE